MNRSSWIAVAALAAAVALMYESCPSTGTGPSPAADRRVLALLGDEALPDCARERMATEHGAAFAPYLDEVLRRQTVPAGPLIERGAALAPCRPSLVDASEETPRATRPQDASPPILPPGSADEVSALVPASLEVLLAVAHAEL